MALIGAGVLWETALAPNVWGGGLIVVGFALGFAAGGLRFSRTPLDGPFLLWAVMMGISLWATALPGVMQSQVVRLMSSLLGCYGLIYWARDRARLVWLAAGVALAGAGLALLAPFVVDWVQPSKIVFVPAGLYKFFPMLVSDPVHPNIMASLLVVVIPLPLAWLLAALPDSRKTRRLTIKALALGAGVFLMLVMLALTRSRGGYLAGAAGVLIALWLAGWRKSAGLLGLAALTTAAWLFSAGQEAALPDLAQGSLDPSTFAFRLQVWRVALWAIADFPFTGVGMGTFNDVAVLLYPFYETKNPGTHNLYLQMGVDLGVPGLVAGLAIVMLALYMAARAMQAFRRGGQAELAALAAGALAGVSALALHGLVDNTMWNTRAAFFPWMMVGLITALYRFAQSTPSEWRAPSGSSLPKSQL